MQPEVALDCDSRRSEMTVRRAAGFRSIESAFKSSMASRQHRCRAEAAANVDQLNVAHAIDSSYDH